MESISARFNRFELNGHPIVNFEYGEVIEWIAFKVI